MTTLRFLLVAATLAFGLAAFASDAKSALTAESSGQLAQAWLAHVDGGDYGQSWKESAARFRATVTEAQWVAMLKQVRQPLGGTASRELTEATFTHEAPRAPKGDYWIVKFTTKFEAISANEFITLTAEADGSWRVVGYFIRPIS
jgi:hypothetical protein